MKLIRYIEFSLFVLLVSIAGNAQAVIVSFENFGAGQVDDLMLADTFAGANTTPGAFHTLPSSTFTFGRAGGITFSGGVLLENPTFTVDFPVAGSVFYGTSNAPTTSALPNPALPNTITIDITESVTSVQGLLVNGLDTTNAGGELADYQVSFFTTDPNNAEFVMPINDVLSNVDGGFAIFSFDSLSMGSMLGNLITRVEIFSEGLDFGMDNPDGSPRLEWDFLVDILSFNEELNPIPIPAALPLFFSALLGGWVFARPRKKPSESIH